MKIILVDIMTLLIKMILYEYYIKLKDYIKYYMKIEKWDLYYWVKTVNWDD